MRWNGPLLSLKPLPYRYNALKPALSAKQVRLHHEQNQAGYVDRANALWKKTGGNWSGWTSSALWKKYRFNRNGAILHELFWETYTPGGRPPSEALLDTMATFGADPESVLSSLRDTSLAIQGSGWGCLSRVGSPQGSTLLVHPITNHRYDWSAAKPLVLVDVWEHAYAVDYWSDRSEYVSRLLPLINWRLVEDRLLEAP